MRFGAVKQVTILATSTILDPRFKKLHFNNYIVCSHAINKIARQMENLNTTNTPTKENVAPTKNLRLSNNIWLFHEDLAKTQLIRDESNDIPTDLKHYLNQPTIELNEDPMDYWTNIKSIYPSLRIIAEQYLPIVATSVPSERLF